MAAEDEHLPALQTAYRAQNLCLFIGAGVSQSCGLPGWKELAARLIERLTPKGPSDGAVAAAVYRGEQPPHDPNVGRPERERYLREMDPLLSMRYARIEAQRSGMDFTSLLTASLYAEASTLSPTIRGIVSMAGVSKICCYNYDDLLHQAFAEQGRPYRPVLVDDGAFPLGSQETMVLYPHGFLPQPRPSEPTYPRATSTLVFSEDDYHELYGAPYAWPNMVQLTLLLTHTVLFVGCSLRDPNIRRLLDVAARMRSRRHFAFFLDPLRDKTHWAPEYDPSTFWVRNEASDVKSIQNSLCGGLGVIPIWLASHDKIPDMLAQIAGVAP